jgi:putative FmdB family regulatory protein
MPIYEYRCESCGHEMDKLQKISDEVLVICPACQQPSLKKLISAAGFRLSGSGWYETDFKKGSKKNLVSGGADKETTSNKNNGDNAKASSTTSNVTSGSQK